MQVSFQMKPAEQAEVLKNLNVGSSRYPSFLDGFSKATDNIRLQRHGKRGMDGEKTNVDVSRTGPRFCSCTREAIKA